MQQLKLITNAGHSLHIVEMNREANGTVSETIVHGEYLQSCKDRVEAMDKVDRIALFFAAEALRDALAELLACPESEEAQEAARNALAMAEPPDYGEVFGDMKFDGQKIKPTKPSKTARQYELSSHEWDIQPASLNVTSTFTFPKSAAPQPNPEQQAQDAAIAEMQRKLGLIT
jgi:hypothetical protein